MLYVSSDSEDGEVDVDVNDLQVYTALVSEHDGLFKKATGAGCALVLPPNQGLPRSITRKFLEHHILRPSRLFKGQYCTLASKTTEVENRDNKFLITIGTGWKYCCKAAISRMDTFYTSSGAPYHVFYTKRHLLSGADLLQNMSSEKTHPDRLQLPGTEEAAKKTISRLSISRHIDGEVHAFDRAYILIPGCAEDAAGKVKQLFHRCSEIVQAKCDSVCLFSNTNSQQESLPAILSIGHCSRTLQPGIAAALQLRFSFNERKGNE
ncbi:hypothetical protein DIPPA_02626 [Diplonema papillatum]|nr:hypothetical protein DIPPA_02626 [Diplonema papillatum]